MLRIDDISFSIEGRPLIDHASAVIPEGHKVGLVGRNGTGKTTLFRLIRGELTLETGDISLPRGARIGGVAQEAPASDVSLIDTVLAADTERAALLAEAEAAQDGLRIAEIQTRLADIDAWSAEARAAAILKGLGFDDTDQTRPCADFSGGWRMRVALAAVLFSRPDLLLLDEPTNYLDLEGALWLENYLARYPHTVIIVSHDRALLNRAVTGILHLEDRKLTYYSGPYDTFAATRAARLAVAEAENRKAEARRAHLQSFVDRFRYKESKARQAQARLKMIERIKFIATPQEAALRRFSFPEPEELSPPIINIEGAACGYGGTPVLSRLDLRIDQDDRIALLGKNGEGKSTLAKLIVGELEAMSGKLQRSSRLRIGYFAQHQMDVLRGNETPLEMLRRLRPLEGPPKWRARLSGFGLNADQADTLIGKLSGGQKARLTLLVATLDAPHLLVLDEPTNHLDIESREALIEALTAYCGAVVLVSHDMHLLSLVADRLWLVKGGRVAPFEDDLAAYAKLLLASDAAATPGRRPGAGQARPDTGGPAPKSPETSRPAPKRPDRDALLALRGELRKCEARVEKLEEMRARLDAKLADPALYEGGRADDIAKWQMKHAEVMQALDRAETLWIEAQEKLDAALGQA
ncbi:MAG: glycosyl transferase family 1 [Rhodobacterales bacterium]|nr:MAG: glycosyl transferase family 1 [Rhodobacterales bacterium]